MPAPWGSRASASNSPSLCRSSVISHRRGRGWRGRMALPIAAAMAESSLAEIRARIARAAAPAGRKPGEVTLIAVSKTQPAEAIEALIAEGQREFGENRVQEAQAKWPELRAHYPDVRLHLIGRLQSNKAAEAVALFDAIHSVDRPSLVAALAKAMAASGRRPECFVQVNIGGEAQKGGCPVAELPALLDLARALPLTGLMWLQIGRAHLRSPLTLI